MFSSLDRPDNRFLRIRGVGKAGEQFIVRLPASGFQRPTSLTTRSLRRILTYPTRRDFEDLAGAILEAHLRELTPEQLDFGSAPQSALLLSMLEPALSEARLATVSASYRPPGAPRLLYQVTVSAMSLHFDAPRDAVGFRPVGPTVTARADPVK